jgi:hypothetical protein
VLNSFKKPVIAYDLVTILTDAVYLMRHGKTEKKTSAFKIQRNLLIEILSDV